MIHSVLISLAPIFFVLALGFGAGRLGRVPADQVPGLNTLVMEFAVPAALLIGVAAAPRDVMLAQWRLFMLLGVGIMVPYAGWFALCRARGRSAGEAAVQALTVGLPNYVAAGLPIMGALYGASGTVLIAVSIAAGTLIPAPVTLVILEICAAEPGQSRASLVGRALYRALTKPIVLAPVLGFLLSMLDLHPGELVRHAFGLIGQAAGGVALFVTGLVVSAQKLRLNHHVLLALVVGLVVQPAFTLAIALVSGTPWGILQVAVLMNALPSGFFGILFAVGYKRPSAEAGSIVLASTIASAVTLAVVIGLLSPNASP